jgi:hypothetical protein
MPLARNLLEKVFQVALLLLKVSAALIRAAFGLRVFVAGQGPGRLFHATFSLVHSAFVLILLTA